MSTSRRNFHTAKDTHLYCIIFTPGIRYKDKGVERPWINDPTTTEIQSTALA